MGGKRFEMGGWGDYCRREWAERFGAEKLRREIGLSGGMGITGFTTESGPRSTEESNGMGALGGLVLPQRGGEAEGAENELTIVCG